MVNLRCIKHTWRCNECSETLTIAASCDHLNPVAITADDGVPSSCEHMTTLRLCGFIHSLAMHPTDSEGGRLLQGMAGKIMTGSQ